MVAISITEAKPGVTVEIDGQLLLITDYKHIKMAQQAVVKLKLKNMNTGSIVERSFRVSEKLEKAHIDYRNMQYLYSSGDDYSFMDQENFEQLTLNKDRVKDVAGYIKEGDPVVLMFYKNNCIGINISNSVVLKVIETGPAYKGDTVTGGSKPATLETGISVQVPVFINVGDMLKIDTRTGQYTERSSA